MAFAQPGCTSLYKIGGAIYLAGVLTISDCFFVNYLFGGIAYNFLLLEGGTAKIVKMIFPLRYNFRSLSDKIPNDFLKFNSSHFTPYVRLIFVDGERNMIEIRTILTFVLRSTATKMFGKIILHD